MKRITILFLALFLLGWGAESNAQGKCFEKGNVLINPGISWGWYGYDFFLANFSISADFGVHDYASVGPYFGMGFYNSSNTYYVVGARGNFHWWQLLDDKVEKDLKQDQLELYFTVWLGGEILSYKYTSDSRMSSGAFDGGVALGFRYYPKGNGRFAIFTEWGRTPLGWGMVGATFRIAKK